MSIRCTEEKSHTHIAYDSIHEGTGKGVSLHGTKTNPCLKKKIWFMSFRDYIKTFPYLTFQLALTRLWTLHIHSLREWTQTVFYQDRKLLSPWDNTTLHMPSKSRLIASHFPLPICWNPTVTCTSPSLHHFHNSHSCGPEMSHSASWSVNLPILQFLLPWTGFCYKLRTLASEYTEWQQCKVTANDQTLTQEWKLQDKSHGQ
jgi:hypothetical protein